MALKNEPRSLFGEDILILNGHALQKTFNIVLNGTDASSKDAGKKIGLERGSTGGIDTLILEDFFGLEVVTDVGEAIVFDDTTNIST